MKSTDFEVKVTLARSSGVMSQNIGGGGAIFARERSDRAGGGGGRVLPRYIGSFFIFRLENVQSGAYQWRKFRLDDMYYYG